METKHTPGPWTVDVAPDAGGFSTVRPDNGTCYGDTDQQPIATVYELDHAGLIAAAPDLLLAAEEYLRLECDPAHAEGSMSLDYARDDLRAAIARARGVA